MCVCHLAGNAGAILVLGRDLVMVPKLIHPLPPDTPRTPDSSGAIDEDPPGVIMAHHAGGDAWMHVSSFEIAASVILAQRLGRRLHLAQVHQSSV